MTGRHPSGSHAQRGLVERDLAVAADLVGDLFPGGGDGIGGFLGRFVLPCVALGQFVLGDRVVLEDAGDTGFDGGVGVVVAVRVRAEVVFDKGAVVACGFPFVILEVRVPVGLEARRIGGGPQRQILAAQVAQMTLEEAKPKAFARPERAKKALDYPIRDDIASLSLDELKSLHVPLVAWMKENQTKYPRLIIPYYRYRMKMEALIIQKK